MKESNVEIFKNAVEENAFRTHIAMWNLFKDEVSIKLIKTKQTYVNNKLKLDFEFKIVKSDSVEFKEITVQTDKENVYGDYCGRESILINRNHIVC